MDSGKAASVIKRHNSAKLERNGSNWKEAGHVVEKFARWNKFWCELEKRNVFGSGVAKNQKV